MLASLCLFGLRQTMYSSGKIIILLGRQQGGGTEAHAHWLYESLRKLNSSVELYVLFSKTYDSNTVQFLSEACRLKFFSRRFLQHCRSEKPALVMCFGRVPNCLGYRIRTSQPSVKLVASCRTNRRLPLGYQKTLALADLVLANSAWAAERLLEKSITDKERLRVLPNALLYPELIDLDRSEQARRDACQSLGLKFDSPVICMLAHFVRGKNQEALIHIIAEGSLPADIQLILSGEGPRKNFCQRLAQRLGVENRVTFTGRIEHPGTVFQASNLIISTSLRDSMPNALVEAQAAGLPVIAYDVAGVNEAFIAGESGELVPVGETTKLVSATNLLLQDSSKRELYSHAARDQARSRFQPDHVLRQYVDYFNDLV